MVDWRPDMFICWAARVVIFCCSATGSGSAIWLGTVGLGGAFGWLSAFEIASPAEAAEAAVPRVPASELPAVADPIALPIAEPAVPIPLPMAENPATTVSGMMHLDLKVLLKDADLAGADIHQDGVVLSLEADRAIEAHVGEPIVDRYSEFW